jgi:sugar phosphate isomerase/epimerase
MKPEISLQMYTLRNEAKEDFLGTLRAVADIGYRYVELAGTGGFGAATLRKHLDGMGLKVSGAHVSLDELQKEIAGVIDYYKTLGAPYVICPWLPVERRRNGSDWLEVGKILAGVAEKVTSAGLGCCYHNHDFEFVAIEGSFPMDLVLGEGGKNLLCELDTFWVQYAGLDPVAMIEKYAARLPLLHVKDMQAGAEKKFAQVGNGIMDWKAIFPAAERAGVKYYVVEQDDCYDVRPLDAVRISFENMKKLV